MRQYTVDTTSLTGTQMSVHLRGITHESIDSFYLDSERPLIKSLTHNSILLVANIGDYSSLIINYQGVTPFSVQVRTDDDQTVTTHFGSSLYLFTTRSSSNSTLLRTLYRVTSWIGFACVLKPFNLSSSVILEGNFSNEEIRELQRLLRGKMTHITKEQILEFFKEHAVQEIAINSYVIVTKSAFKGERAIVKENFPKTKESRIEFVNFGRGITFVLPWEYFTSTGEKYSEDNN